MKCSRIFRNIFFFWLLINAQMVWSGGYQVKVQVYSGKQSISFSRTVQADINLVTWLVNSLPQADSPSLAINDMLEPDIFLFYYGHLVPVLGFDPVFEGLLQFLKTDPFYNNEKDLEMMAQASPLNAIYWFSELGRLLGRDLNGLGQADPAQLNIEDYMVSQQVTYGGISIPWPLPTGLPNPFEHGFLTRVLVDTLTALD